ncbi:hypothetical protein ScPMuIL_002532 [Solemya velum]
MAGNLPDSGEILLVEEIIESDRDFSLLEGKCVRVIGRLEEHNLNGCIARISDPRSGRSLHVDTLLVEPFDATLLSLFQFVGELDCLSQSRKRVLARVNQLLAEHGVSVKCGYADVHQDQAIVERLNRTLSERLFGHQYA